MKEMLSIVGSVSLLAMLGACSSSMGDMGSGSTADGGMGSMGDAGRGSAGDGGMDMGDGGMTTPSGDPTSVAIAPVTVDAVYVINGGDKSISVVDPAKSAVIGTIKLQNVSFPHHAYLSPDRSMLAVADPGMDFSGGHTGGMEGMKGAILVLDAKTGATMASRRMDAMNHNGAFSPDGSEIWTSAMTMAGKVLVLDAMTLKTKMSITVGDMPAEVTFAKDGKHAFVANGMSNDVTVIDTATKAVVKTVPVDQDPVGAWPGANGVMYVDCETAKTVKAIDATTFAVTQTYKLGFTPGMAKTTPAGNSLWVTNSDTGEVVFDMTTQDMTMGKTATGVGAHGIAFSDDAKLGFVTNQGAGTLTILNVGTQKVVGNVTVGAKPNGLVFRAR
jgi:YVTN family beta-propeller protein